MNEDNITRTNFHVPTTATLSVVYMDGTVEKFTNVCYQCSSEEPNPVKVDGTTVEIETRDSALYGRIVTLCGVRRFEFI